MRTTSLKVRWAHLGAWAALSAHRPRTAPYGAPTQMRRWCLPRTQAPLHAGWAVSCYMQPSQPIICSHPALARAKTEQLPCPLGVIQLLRMSTVLYGPCVPSACTPWVGCQMHQRSTAISRPPLRAPSPACIVSVAAHVTGSTCRSPAVNTVGRVPRRTRSILLLRSQQAAAGCGLTHACACPTSLEPRCDCRGNHALAAHGRRMVPCRHVLEGSDLPLAT